MCTYLCPSQRCGAEAPLRGAGAAPQTPTPSPPINQRDHGQGQWPTRHQHRHCTVSTGSQEKAAQAKRSPPALKGLGACPARWEGAMHAARGGAWREEGLPSPPRSLRTTAAGGAAGPIPPADPRGPRRLPGIWADLHVCGRGGRFCGKMRRGPAGPRQEGNSPQQSGHWCEGSAVSSPGDFINNSAVPRESLLRSLFFPLNFPDEGSNSRSNGTDLAGDQLY